MWVNIGMTRPDLSHLSSEEKDALIVALLDRLAALEAKLRGPPKTPNNSSVPPSRGQKGNRPPRPKKPRRNGSVSSQGFATRCSGI
jgi:transposase